MTLSHSVAKSTMVEGIGDEFVLGATCFVTSIVFIIYYFWRNRSQNAGMQRIHPQSESLVRDVQAELNRRGNERRSRRMPQDQCPICLGEVSFGVETNCGHIYCGLCILTYWQHGSWGEVGAMKCAVCRQQVSLLLTNFSEEDQRTTSETKDRVAAEIGRYNRRFSGEPVPLMDYIRDLPTLLSHLIREFFSVSGLILMFRLRILVCFLLALIYFVSPLDIVPEAAFGILGFLDDFVILLLLAIYVSIMYRYHVGQRSQ